MSSDKQQTQKYLNLDSSLNFSRPISSLKWGAQFIYFQRVFEVVFNKHVHTYTGSENNNKGHYVDM